MTPVPAGRAGRWGSAAGAGEGVGAESVGVIGIVTLVDRSGGVSPLDSAVGDWVDPISARYGKRRDVRPFPPQEMQMTTPRRRAFVIAAT